MSIDFTAMKDDIKAYVASVVAETKAFVAAHAVHWGLGSGTTLIVQWVISHAGAILSFVKSVL